MCIRDSVSGVEFAYIQHLSFLPGGLHGLGISANYSYTTSEARGLTGTPTHRPLLRQAPHTWNVSPTYDRPRLSLRTGLSYNGANIFQYYDPTGDVANLGPKGPAGDLSLIHISEPTRQAEISYAVFCLKKKKKKKKDKKNKNKNNKKQKQKKQNKQTKNQQ